MARMKRGNAGLKNNLVAPLRGENYYWASKTALDLVAIVITRCDYYGVYSRAKIVILRHDAYRKWGEQIKKAGAVLIGS